MVGAMRQHAPIFTVASFRAWLRSRPDEERWQLIEGIAMMMAPPNRRHQRIASNLERLLNDALKRHDPAFAAYQNIGVNIVSTVPYDPQPDVAVIREDENPDPRYADRFYLAAEIYRTATRTSSTASAIYRAHASCKSILLISQESAEIIVDRRSGESWRPQVLRAADELALPDFGFSVP
jgi:Uma2 family endonuclease